MNPKNTPRAVALLPIAVFLALYLGLGIVLEYVLKVEMGFYQIPIVVAFLVAILVACLQNRGVSFDEKLTLMGQGIGDRNIVTMILIFLAAGIFVGVTGRSSAEAVAYFLLSIAPAKLAVAVLFVVACFVSMAMGTSVGTITLLTPIAVAVSKDSGFSLPLCVASVMGGSMFGDNLSFISDTTIAACSTQGCQMKDKFRANFKIALPAALAALALIVVISLQVDVTQTPSGDHNLLLLIPYVLVLIGGIVGLNVFVVLLVGIAAGAAITLATGQVTAMQLMGNMGSGVSGMSETILVTLLVASLCGLIRAYGGFEALLAAIRKIFRGKRGGQLGIGILVGLMDISTANNTVAIVMAGPIAKDIAAEYGLTPKRSASLTAPRCWWPFPLAPHWASPSAPSTLFRCCFTPCSFACPAYCSLCLTGNNPDKKTGGATAPPVLLCLLKGFPGSLTAGTEGFEIQFLDLGGHGLGHHFLPVDFRTAQRVAHGTEKHHVHALGIAQLNGDFASLEGDGLEILLHGLQTAGGIFLLSGGDGKGVHLIIVDDGHAGGLQELGVTHGFHLLQSHQNIGLSFAEHRGVDLLAPAHLGGHAAAPLRHTVNFALLDIVSGLHKAVGHDLGDQDSALTANATQQHTLDIGHLTFPPSR